MPQAPHNIYWARKGRELFCFSSLPLFFLLLPPPAAPGIPKYEPAAINSAKDMPPPCHPAVLGEGRAGGQPAAAPARGRRGGAGRVLGTERCCFPPAPPPASTARLHPRLPPAIPAAARPGLETNRGWLEASGRASSAYPRREGLGDVREASPTPATHPRTPPGRRGQGSGGAAVAAALPRAAGSSSVPCRSASIPGLGQGLFGVNAS